MKETNFIDQNKDKWQELETLLKEERKDPDKLSSLFIKVSDDLSYARTFYPNRYVRVYLNDLAQQLFHSLYKNKKNKSNRFFLFWKEQLPDLMYSVRKELLTCLVIFIISVVIGVFSMRHDPGFARIILGDSYIKMTEENIRKGDPMGVYKQSEGTIMFLQIAINNLRVDFYIFVLGVVVGIGSVFMVMYNGIMVGVFQYFFFRAGLFLTSFLSIWLHGTLEMSAMIIAGAAGITMGKGLVFPGTFRRNQSFFIGTRKGIKILISTFPITIVAALIESYLTRHTEMPAVWKGLLIFASFTFILLYFVIYPYLRHKRGHMATIEEADLQPESTDTYDYQSVQSSGNIFKEVFNFFRDDGGKILRMSLGAGIAATALTAAINHYMGYNRSMTQWTPLISIFHYGLFPPAYFINTIFLALIFYYTSLFICRRENRAFRTGRFTILQTILFSALINLIPYTPLWAILLILIFLGPMLFLWYGQFYYHRTNLFKGLFKSYKLFSATVLTCYGNYFLLLLTATLGFLILQSPLLAFYIAIIQWNYTGDDASAKLFGHLIVDFTS